MKISREILEAVSTSLSNTYLKIIEEQEKKIATLEHELKETKSIANFKTLGAI